MNKTNDFQTSNAEMVTISRAEYERFQGQEQQLLALNERLAQMEQQIEGLMEALRLANHKRFGASSEKTEETLMEQLSFLFNEAEVFAAEKEEVTEIAGHKRRKKNNDYTIFAISSRMKDVISKGVFLLYMTHHLVSIAIFHRSFIHKTGQQFDLLSRLMFVGNMEPIGSFISGLLAYTVPLNESVSWNHNWTGHYGTLEPEQYRFCKIITDSRAPGVSDDVTFYAEFQIVN